LISYVLFFFYLMDASVMLNWTLWLCIEISSHIISFFKEIWIFLRTNFYSDLWCFLLIYDITNRYEKEIHKQWQKIHDLFIFFFNFFFEMGESKKNFRIKFFEALVIVEFLKSFWHNFWRWGNNCKKFWCSQKTKIAKKLK